MVATPPIRMLEQMSTVKPMQAMCISWKVCRDPIKNDPNVMLMKIIDEEFEIIGRPISRSRSKKSRYLVTPRRIIWVFHDWHQLNVRETEPLNVLNNTRRELASAGQRKLDLQAKLAETRRSVEALNKQVAGLESELSHAEPEKVLWARISNFRILDFE